MAAYFLRSFSSGRDLTRSAPIPRRPGWPASRSRSGCSWRSCSAAASPGSAGSLWATQYNTIDATAAQRARTAGDRRRRRRRGRDLRRERERGRRRAGRAAAADDQLGALRARSLSIWTEAIAGFLLLVAITLDRVIQLRLAAALRSGGSTLEPERPTTARARRLRRRDRRPLRNVTPRAADGHPPVRIRGPWETALGIALVLVVLLGTSVSSQFLSSYNIFTALHEHRRPGDHGAADDADHHHRRDRPVGGLDARAFRRNCSAICGCIAGRWRDLRGRARGGSVAGGSTAS